MYYLNNGWERVQQWVKWDRVYSINPIGDHEQWQDNVLGGEFGMWGESTDSSNYIQHSFARLSAGSERLWSGLGNYPDPKRRAVRHRCRMLRRGLSVRALDFDNGDWRRGRWYQCEVYLHDVAAARGSPIMFGNLDPYGDEPGFFGTGPVMSANDGPPKAANVGAPSNDPEAARLRTQVDSLRAECDNATATVALLRAANEESDRKIEALKLKLSEAEQAKPADAGAVEDVRQVAKPDKQEGGNWRDLAAELAAERKARAKDMAEFSQKMEEAMKGMSAQLDKAQTHHQQQSQSQSPSNPVSDFLVTHMVQVAGIVVFGLLFHRLFLRRR